MYLTILIFLSILSFCFQNSEFISQFQVYYKQFARDVTDISSRDHILFPNIVILLVLMIICRDTYWSRIGVPIMQS